MPRLVWGEGKDTSLAAALEASARAAGDTREDLYDAVMAGSGIAFQLRIDDRWDPSSVTPYAAGVVERAARAAGLRADVVDPPFDDELRELVRDRLVESVDAGLPPLARGLRGLAEFGVITGYESEGRVLFARTYADHGDEPSRVSFQDTADTPFVFLERGAAQDEKGVAREAIQRAVEVSTAATHEADGMRLYAGEAAFAEWIEALRADVPPREAAQRAFVDHARRVFLHDARRAAARFLRRVRRHFPDRVGAELIRAAEGYGYVADECEKSGARPFEASVVARFLDPSLRRGWAHALERALAREREAASALGGAAALVH